MVLLLLLAACDSPRHDPPPATTPDTAPSALALAPDTNSSYGDAARAPGSAQSAEQLAELFEAEQRRFKQNMELADERFRRAQALCEEAEGETRESCENAAAATHEADTKAARMWLDEALGELLKSE